MVCVCIYEEKCLLGMIKFGLGPAWIEMETLQTVEVSNLADVCVK